MGGLSDYLDAAAGVLSPVSAVAGWAASGSSGDRALSEEQARDAQNGYLVRNAIDSGAANQIVEQRKAAGYYGPAKPAPKAAAPTPAAPPKPVAAASGGTNYVAVGGGAVALLGAFVAYRQGHGTAAAALGAAGLGALGWGLSQ